MDNLTHSLTGLMLGRAGLDRCCPRAGWLLLLASNAPDIDAVYLLTSDPALYLEHHRGISHSLAGAPFLALLPALALGLAARNGFPWLRAWLLSLTGVLSHLMLDWTNVYGIRLLSPFSEEWLRLDTTFVVDLWIWLVLIAASLWPLLAGLVSSEIGARRTPGRGVARTALAAILLFDGGRWMLHLRAVETLHARMHAGENPRAVAAFPTIANPLRWSGLAQVRNGYVVHEIDLAGEFDPADGKIYYHSDPSPALEAAKATPAFQAFLAFAQFPLWRVSQPPEREGVVKVEASDLRFGIPGQGRFTATCLVDQSGRVLESAFRFGTPAALW